MIKLIAVDLDGTALNSQREMTETTRAALDKVGSQGINVVPATGRIMGLIPQEVLDLSGVEYLITCNGAQIFDLKSDKAIYENPILPEQLEVIEEILEPYDTLIHYYLGKETYIKDSNQNRLSEFMPDELVKLFYENSEFLNEEDLENLLKEHAPLKIDYRINSIPPQERQEVFDRIKSIDGIEIILQEDGACEITHNNSIKGNALRILSNNLNIIPTEILAIGDSLNDLSMLTYAGKSIAMKQSNPVLKDKVDIITDTNDNEGVSKALNSLFQFNAS